MIAGYQELSETQRALESESRLRGWQGVKGAVSDAAAYVTPFRLQGVPIFAKQISLHSLLLTAVFLRSKVTPRVRNEYKKK